MSQRPLSSFTRISGVLLLLGLVAFGLAALKLKQKGVLEPARPTTYSSAPGGYKALYMWLKALGIPIQRWKEDLRRLPAEATVLLIIEPELGPEKEELDALRSWVEGGGNLALVSRPSNLFLESFGLEADDGEPLESGNGEATVIQPGPYTHGVKNLSSWHGPGMVTARPQVIFHMRDAGRGLLAGVHEGKGRVMALSAPEFLSNMSLREADHAKLALNLVLCHLDDGILLVDEYHHGYGRAASVFQYLDRSGVTPLMLQGLLLILVLWAALGKRFGPKRPPTFVERRSSLEHVQSMARLFRRARASGFALGAMTRWIEEEAKEDLVNTDRALQSAMRTTRASLQGEHITDRELLITVRALYHALEAARRRATAERRG
jgi:hypothetical protein